MTKVAAIAKLTAQDGKRDELVAVLREVVDQVGRTEQGTDLYVLHEDAADGNAVWFWELYADQEAFQSHAQGEALKAAGPRMAPLLAGRPELTFLRPVAAHGTDV